MSALDNAKAVLARYNAIDSDDDPGYHDRVDAAIDGLGALAALIAEHERVLAERAAPQEWEYGVWSPILRQVHSVGASYMTREHAEAVTANSSDHYGVRRRPVGPWEPLPEDANQTNERSKR